jgi:hypothetical protein
MFLYNHIRGLPLRVVAHNTGSVTSIAVAVFLAAEERYFAPPLGMFHDPSDCRVVERRDVGAATSSELARFRARPMIAGRKTFCASAPAIPEELLTRRRFKDVYITHTRSGDLWPRARG